ncbi:unnamed protein product, partial [Symbiodinium microadriaticum]
MTSGEMPDLRAGLRDALQRVTTDLPQLRSLRNESSGAFYKAATSPGFGKATLLSCLRGQLWQRGLSVTIPNTSVEHKDARGKNFWDKNLACEREALAEDLCFQDALWLQEAENAVARCLYLQGTSLRSPLCSEKSPTGA